MIILSVDPGKNNGWVEATVDLTAKKMQLIGIGTDLPEQFRKQLMGWMKKHPHELRPEIIVVEDFLNRPQKTQSGAFDWSENLTSQMIGSLQLAADFLGAPLVKQQPSLKVPGYGFLGKEYKKGKGGMHHWDAYAHLAYYLVTKHQFRPPDLKVT